MFEYLKVKNHKGITSPVELNDLGHINILCGKNNSGKTSILEAINNGKNLKNVAIGRKFDRDELIVLFKSRFNEHIVNYPPIIKIFSDYCDENTRAGTVLYTDKIDEHIKGIITWGPLKSYIHNHTINFRPLFEDYFSRFISDFNPLLLVPKRSLRVCPYVSVDRGAYFQNDGEYITNLLFHLKNQNPGTSDAEKYTKICNYFEKITNW